MIWFFPAGPFPSLRARLARLRGIPLLEATPTCAEGRDKEARASLGYEASTGRELDGEIEIDRGRQLYDAHVWLAL
jgi:hypothetical protein